MAAVLGKLKQEGSLLGKLGKDQRVEKAEEPVLERADQATLVGITARQLGSPTENP